ncbi:MAG: hypothetical protein GY945_01570, partial [Rhodobacteraceae bacterium]|nr:hypothetical protein [Paracoccaceae bacterium]
ECRKYARVVAGVAVKTGVVALGLPPTIPSYNELIDRGVDYAVELAAEEIESRTGVPCFGPCEDLLRESMSAFANELKRETRTEACVDPTEAHARGREPLCVPPSVIAKPALNATTTLPFIEVTVTRTATPVPEVTPDGFTGSCGFSIGSNVRHHFDARRWPGPNVNIFRDLPAQDVNAWLYEGHSGVLDVNMAPGTQKIIGVPLSAIGFQLPWNVEMWRRSQSTQGRHPGPYNPDWLFVFYDGEMSFEVTSSYREPEYDFASSEMTNPTCLTPASQTSGSVTLEAYR